MRRRGGGGMLENGQGREVSLLCVYIYIYIYTHTHTHLILLIGLITDRAPFVSLRLII